jgi:hypothetical protein
MFESPTVPTQCTLQHMFEDGMLLIWIDPKCEWAISLMYPPFFCKLRFSSSPINKHVMEFGMEIQTALSR